MTIYLQGDKGFQVLQEPKEVYDEAFDHEGCRLKSGEPFSFQYTKSFIKLFDELKPSELKVFWYMLAYTNKRSVNRYGEDWANLGFYFDTGFLCFARNYSYMARDLEYNSEPTLRNRIGKLHKLGLIRRMSWELIKLRNNEVKPITIWATGELIRDENGTSRIHFYYELSPSERIRLMEHNLGILDNRGISFADYKSMDEVLGAKYKRLGGLYSK